MTTDKISKKESRSLPSGKKTNQEKPDEVPFPDQDPKTVPGREPGPDVWPHKEPEIDPGHEPLTVPPGAPNEVPTRPEY